MVYMDEILLAGLGDPFIEVRKPLAGRFNVTNRSDCYHFVGVMIERLPSGIFLSHKPFMGKLIARAGMTSAEPVPAPL